MAISLKNHEDRIKSLESTSSASNKTIYIYTDKTSNRRFNLQYGLTRVPLDSKLTVKFLKAFPTNCLTVITQTTYPNAGAGGNSTAASVTNLTRESFILWNDTSAQDIHWLAIGY